MAPCHPASVRCSMNRSKSILHRERMQVTKKMIHDRHILYYIMPSNRQFSCIQRYEYKGIRCLKDRIYGKEVNDNDRPGSAVAR